MQNKPARVPRVLPVNGILWRITGGKQQYIKKLFAVNEGIADLLVKATSRKFRMGEDRLDSGGHAHLYAKFTPEHSWYKHIVGKCVVILNPNTWPETPN